MSKHYADIAFTSSVRKVQEHHGTAGYFPAPDAGALADSAADPLGLREQTYLEERDGMYLASMGETGWPYVQFRGGPPGFLKVLDKHTIGWADFEGNLQYVSTGNISAMERVSIIAVDYASQTRLKLFGRARIVTPEDGPDILKALTVEGYQGAVERAVIVEVEAYDWNCPRHITPRYTLAELEEIIDPVRQRVGRLEAENAALRARLAKV
ncbi:pyridoxamine 5'-phosphate oxidase family protein [Arthrobacter sp. MSA 4-2]|uniref:pyridoxamine 5'-phosphate oxidase family protein n=1 Tax=Arthrobacter sp. MSA 4-2 TaxID=2794349 RepID=UPI0018E7BDB0|nr:pyridoxamine 5'-phosphate oxidase family protein [Arthrobacter sp. MSA 4-2]MBJ2122547.1 pyridoxamine 5'-phosphate oxidase family protein [Arthrobacter sp. MSA 4-2]